MLTLINRTLSLEKQMLSFSFGLLLLQQRNVPQIYGGTLLLILIKARC